MKRILILTLCVVLLCTTLVFSASAVEVNDKTYIFNDSIFYGQPIEGDILVGNLSFTSVIASNGALYGYAPFEEPVLLYSNGNGWHDPTYKTWTIYYADLTEDNLVWLNANTLTSDIGESTQKPPGGVYPSFLPPLPSDVSEDRHAVVIHNTDGFFLFYAMTDSAILYGDAITNQLYWQTGFSGATGGYWYDENDNTWGWTESWPSGERFSTKSEIWWSQKDIYTENGELFFQLPLWVTVEKVTQGGIATEIPKVHSSMGLLVVLAVGLLALLMGLAILPKVLYKFL